MLSFVLAAAALGCLIAGFWALRRKRLIDDLPTSKTQGVFIGMAELKGTAESESPLTSYLAGSRCVQYSWGIEEHWSRTVHETHTDSKGHTQTRTRVESGWTPVARDTKAVPFYLKDDTGVIRIVPEGATINGIATFDETCSRGDPLYFGKGPAGEVANSTHRRRFHETALPLHTTLYVMGQARERQDAVAAEIARDRNADMFLISTRTEKQFSTGYGRWSWFWLVLGAALAAGSTGIWGLPQGPFPGAGWGQSVPGLAIFSLALVLGWVWAVYNSLVNLHHRVEQGWSQVDVQLKRRHDLIANLVSTVEGYRSYEKEALEVLTALRGQSRPDAGVDSRGISPELRIIAERYPDLKASGPFLALQQSLVDTEQRIALARDYCNDVATFFNTRLGIVPDRFVARLAGLRPRALMNAADFERAPVKVKLVS